MTCIKCGRVYRPLRRSLCHSCYETNRTRQKAYGRWETMYVGTEEVRQHILMLKASGLGDRRIAELAGVARNNVREVLTGRPGRSRSERMLRRNADAILAVQADPAPGANVDACGTVRRLRALVAIGYTQSDLCERLGLLPGNGCQLFRGEREFVTAATAGRVAELYDDLAMTPGTSDRARRHATKHRWAPPLAWDDDLIDNPDARPDLGQHQSVSWGERYLEMRELGYSDLEILARLNIQAESMLRQLDRYGIKPSPELMKHATGKRHQKRVAS